MIEIAKHVGNCYLCGQPIHVDDEIKRWNAAGNPVAAHRACIEPRPADSPVGAPPAGTPLHQPIEDLVRRFAEALRLKLIESEQKYDWDNGWLSNGWEEDLRCDIRKHIEKGDPRDVAAYCAFAWHHGWSLASPSAEICGQEYCAPEEKPDSIHTCTREAGHEFHEDATHWWKPSAPAGTPPIGDTRDK